MSDTTTYKTSDNTPAKQESLRWLLWHHMDIVKTIWKKRDYMRFYKEKIRPYRYYELHGGYGIDEVGNPGSPLIFQEVIAEHKLPYKAIIYERDLEAYESLKIQVEEFEDIYVCNEDHHQLFDIYNQPKYKRKDKYRDHHFGVVYSDPSNADPSFEVLRAITSAYPKIDVIINLAAASYKHTRHLDDYKDLKTQLLSTKDVWIIRKPRDTHQWTMLLGTSWDGFPQWEEKDFVRFDSDLGREWFDRVAYTKDENHKKQYSSTLFDTGNGSDEVKKK